MKILITGGAGFIGQKLIRELLKYGDEIRILDNFNEQIHAYSDLPDDIANKVTLYKASVLDKTAVASALSEVECLVHLAAETGTGQSMYEIEKYFNVNVQGTAVLLDVLQNTNCGINLKSIIVASSRAIYGEGAYTCQRHNTVFPDQRTRINLSNRLFDPICPLCGDPLQLTPTSENAPFKPMSVYGLTKQVQEQAILMYARTRGINGFALRYQNVFGPGQSLKNPYTGILAVFSNLARQNENIEVYEDGDESRDFVYIDDVVDATVLAIKYSGSYVGALNVGSGKATSVMSVAKEIVSFFDSTSSIAISGAFRIGDIRHNIADISEIERVLGFKPKTDFKDGLGFFLEWAASQPEQNKAAYGKSVMELVEKGLMGNVGDNA
ncbi:NAD-dependent epimerase/dehydratase family protein [Undibacterium sp. B2R-29]|jgi:dTDP-L-rhamnose 4-epimerase|nr:NAD-dependent epimerase/dehydratase family protein [Undibacterium crateris]